MLVGQAALSFELWTGKRPDVGPVLRELRSRLSPRTAGRQLAARHVDRAASSSSG